MPRCCQPDPGELAPCYASVLAHGPDPRALGEAVRALEAQPIVSCFTAWCARCDSVYLLDTAVDRFPCPSAHHTHQLGLLQRMRAAGIHAQEAVFKPAEAAK